MAKVFPALLYFELLVFLMSLCTYERISRFGLFSALPPFDYQGRKSAGRRVAVSDIFCQFYQQWTKIERPENLMDLQESFSLCVCIATAHHSSLLLVRCLLWPWLWLLFFFVIYLNKLADFYFDFSFCFRLFLFLLLARPRNCIHFFSGWWLLSWVGFYGFSPNFSQAPNRRTFIALLHRVEKKDRKNYFLVVSTISNPPFDI